jgi:pyruvate,water dikinase
VTKPSTLIIPLAACGDPALVGGKAAGLGRLIRAGFRVPLGVCLATTAYHETLRAVGLDLTGRWAQLRRLPDAERDAALAETRRAVESVTLPKDLADQLDRAIGQQATTLLWAVRSSAVDEDATGATFGGIYRSVLGVPREAIARAVTTCWASFWTPAALVYRSRIGTAGTVPAMAVVLQPMLGPRAAGVVYSQHPVTGRTNQVVINAVFGLGEPLVAGRVTPDQFVVHVGAAAAHSPLLEQTIADKPTRRDLTASGLLDRDVPPEDRRKPALGEQEASELARLAKQVERVFTMPVDVEWALDETGLWLLQARAIPAQRARPSLTEAACVWSRANFKETLPELPSPLGLSFLHEFMERAILKHYRDLGCVMPPDVASVRVIHGRPFINVTLFQSLVTQLGGDPAQVVEQMGGDASVAAPSVPRLAWWRVLRALVLAESRIRRAARRAPKWFAEIKAMADDLSEDIVRTWAPVHAMARLQHLGRRLYEGDLTFAIVAGVAQGLQALQFILERGFGPGWRPLMNASLQGLGTVISVNQILRLQDLADVARQEPAACAFFNADPFTPELFRAKLAGTRFLQGFEAYLLEYGHRALGESDVMAPRFRERPEPLLHVIRQHLLAPPAATTTDIQRDQEAARTKALQEIRRALGPWVPRWWAFRWWHRRLGRYLALREANRHHLMHFADATRRLQWRIGEHLTARGALGHPDDVFFLTADEFRSLLDDTGRDWKSLVATRRQERAKHAEQTVPDLVRPVGLPTLTAAADDGPILRGVPISIGLIEGPARLVLSPEDASTVQRGDILIVPVIDPGMAPLFGLAAGLIAEMGGTLSHGAIIAREYGLPAIVNVPGVTQALRTGERIVVDATVGAIRRVGPQAPAREGGR